MPFQGNERTCQAGEPQPACGLCLAPGEIAAQDFCREVLKMEWVWGMQHNNFMKNGKPVSGCFSVLGSHGRLNPLLRFGKQSAEIICSWFVIFHLLDQTNPWGNGRKCFRFFAESLYDFQSPDTVVTKQLSILSCVFLNRYHLMFSSLKRASWLWGFICLSQKCSIQAFCDFLWGFSLWSISAHLVERGFFTFQKAVSQRL